MVFFQIPLVDAIVYPIRLTIFEKNGTIRKERARIVNEGGGIAKLKLLKAKVTMDINKEAIFIVQGMFQRKEAFMFGVGEGKFAWAVPKWVKKIKCIRKEKIEMMVNGEKVIKEKEIEVYEDMPIEAEGDMDFWMKEELKRNTVLHQRKKEQWERVIPWVSMGIYFFICGIGIYMLLDQIAILMTKFPAAGELKILCDCATNNATFVPKF